MANTYFGAPDESGQHGEQNSGRSGFSASPKWQGASNHPSPPRGVKHVVTGGQPVANPKDHLNQMKMTGGLKGCGGSI